MTRARPPKRRTQQERRETTIRKLLDAATDVLIEEGYAGASVQRICARAGISQGGLFRHFTTRDALMVAAADDVGEKILADFELAYARRKKTADPIVLALELLRDSCRSKINQAWYELSIAARTSDTLRKALAPIASRYYEKIDSLGRVLLPDLAASLGGEFHALVATVVAIFDGESVQRFIVRDPRVEQARFDVAVMLARAAAQGAAPAKPAKPAKLARPAQPPLRERRSGRIDKSV